MPPTTQPQANPSTLLARRPGRLQFILWATADVFFYIESFYNRRRRHSALDYLSPEAYEQLCHQQKDAFA
jgi:transposase InsO family protein